jgi:MFS transporter, DHA2 family, lincomycin resistance protein
MLSLAAVFTPVFTISLGALPPHLYPHGSSMVATLQQVAAAFGTALAVTVMTLRAGQLTADGVVADGLAQLGGMRLAFLIGGVLSIVVVVTALRMPQRATATIEAAADDSPDMPYDEFETAR